MKKKIKKLSGWTLSEMKKYKFSDPELNKKVSLKQKVAMLKALHGFLIKVDRKSVV